MKNKKHPHLTALPPKAKTAERAKNPTAQKAVWAREHNRQGQAAERLAVWFLRLKFYRIIGRNIRVRGGEIDIVARRGKLLVFIEVKSRRSIWLAAQAVAPRQWHRIEKAATQFVAARPRLARLSWRFDVVALAPRRWPRHIIDAWRRA